VMASGERGKASGERGKACQVPIGRFSNTTLSVHVLACRSRPMCDAFIGALHPLKGLLLRSILLDLPEWDHDLAERHRQYTGRIEGKATLKGTRIRVSLILGYLADGPRRKS